MTENSRRLSKDSIETLSRMLRLDLTAVDAEALLERVNSGLEDLNRADEICPDRHEPAVTFTHDRVTE